MKIVLLMLSMLIAGPALAHKCKCAVGKPHTHVYSHTHRKANPTLVPAPAPAPAKPALLAELLEEYDLHVGYRWDHIRKYGTATEAAGPTLTDPPYVGIGLKLPLSENVAFQGIFDRDLVDAANWQARVQLAWQPFSYGKK